MRRKSSAPTPALPDGTRWEGFVLVDRFYDGQRGTIESSPRVLELRNGRIAGVDSGPAPPRAPALDLRGLLVMPPLVEPHGHLYMSPWPLDPKRRIDPGSKGRHFEGCDAVRRAEMAFRAGIGLFRDLGDPLGCNLAVRRAAEDPARALPRIQAAGAAIHRVGRYGRFIGEGVPDPSGMAAAVRRRIEEDRVDVLKLVPTGIINFQKARVTAPPQLETPEIAAAVAAARRAGVSTSAHASGAEGIARAVAGGVDFVEHAYFVEDETLRAMADRGTVWTPTLAPVHVQWVHAAECGLSVEVAGGLRRILDRHAEQILLGRRLGVRILAGSDSGAPGVEQGRGLVLELELLEAIGIPAPDLLRGATRAAADLLGATALGRLEAGSPADFIVVDGHPERSIAELSKVVHSIRGGRFFHGAALADAARPAWDRAVG